MNCFEVKFYIFQNNDHDNDDDDDDNNHTNNVIMINTEVILYLFLLIGESIICQVNKGIG